MPGPRFDPRQALLRLTEPGTWSLFAALAPPAALHALVPLVQELEQAALDPEEQRLRDGLLAANVERLSPGLSPRRTMALVRRHLRLQALRRAEELLLLQGDVGALLRWAEQARPTGLAHAERLAGAGHGVIVASAHCGPMVLYPPLLARCLTRCSRAAGPELLCVANAPSSPLLEQRLQLYAEHHGCRLGVVVKQPDGEVTLLRRLLPALARGAWVLLQIDVLSGGSTTRPLPFAGGALRLPAAWGAARLAAHCRVPLLPVLATRDRAGRPGLAIEPPLQVEQQDGATSATAAAGRRGSPHPAVARTAAALAAVLERWVHRDPADWMMLAHLHLLEAASSPQRAAGGSGAAGAAGGANG